MVLTNNLKIYETCKWNNRIESLEQSIEWAIKLLQNIKSWKWNVLLNVFQLNDYLYKKNLTYKDVNTSMVEIQRLVDKHVKKLEDPKYFFASCEKVIKNWMT